jgi:hypothetical protein
MQPSLLGDHRTSVGQVLCPPYIPLPKLPFPPLLHKPLLPIPNSNFRSQLPISSDFLISSRKNPTLLRC